MEKLEINTNNLRTDVENMKSEIGYLRREMFNLQETAVTLGSTWEGEAKKAFDSALSDDMDKLGQLVDEIEKYINNTDSARTEYEKCENAVSGIVQSIKV